MLNIVNIEATTLPDAWFQCVYRIIEPGVARKRLIDSGSYEGQFRLEFDFIIIHILFPGSRPLIPDIPPGYGIPPPTDMDYVDGYFGRYLMTDVKAGNEQYTYGERLVHAPISVISHIDREQTFLGASGPEFVNQMEIIIERYKKYGPGNNQMILQVGQPADIMLKDPPCLRQIDTRIEKGKLHFIIYFRSWDLWGGLPANLGGIQLVKEYMAEEIGVEDGEMICLSKGLHLYDHCWEVAGIRRGLSAKEIAILKQVPEKEAQYGNCWEKS